jgi:hypothetical protein
MPFSALGYSRIVVVADDEVLVAIQRGAGTLRVQLIAARQSRRGAGRHRLAGRRHSSVRSWPRPFPPQMETAAGKRCGLVAEMVVADEEYSQSVEG